MRQEINGQGKHRLVAEDGTVTEWAGYTQFTYLQGMVGFTAYYAAREGILPANEFCAQQGVSVADTK